MKMNDQYKKGTLEQFVHTQRLTQNQIAKQTFEENVNGVRGRKRTRNIVGQSWRDPGGGGRWKF